MIQMETKTIMAAGVPTRYVEAGEAGKSTLILIQAGAYAQTGFHNNLHCWELVLDGLARDFNVLALDTLGQGGTSLPAGRADLAFDDIVDHVAAFIATLGLTQVHLVGHDEGALVAVRLAFEQPQIVRSCCAVNANTLAPPGDSIDNPQFTSSPFEFGSAAAQRWVLERSSSSRHHIDTGSFLAEAVSLSQADGDKEARRAQSERVENSTNRLRIENFARFRDEGFPVPMLILWGNDDAFAKRTQAEQWGQGHLYSAAASGRSLFDAIAPKQPITQLKLISGVGHMPFREAPVVFTGSVASFAKAVERDIRKAS